MKIKEVLGFVPLICLDDGHGMETAGKRTPKFSDGHFIHENEFNRAVIDLVLADAKRLGFLTKHVSPGDNDVSLQTRTTTANAAYSDYQKQLNGKTVINGKPISIFISEHYNAMADTWEGSTAEGAATYYYTGSIEGKKLATAIQKCIIQGTPQKNRGIVEAGFYVLKYTNMPAVLIEAGFMDDPREAALMTNKAFQKETAEQVMQGICEYYGLTYEKEIPDQNTKSVQEIAVDNAIADKVLTDRSYWLDVLTGVEVAKKEWLLHIFNNYHAALEQCKKMK